MPAAPSSYDARIIERFAEKLHRKAATTVLAAVVVGTAMGAGFGAVPLTSLGAAWPIPHIFGVATLLVGGVLGAFIGYVIGDARSFDYRLQAETALCQLQAERNAAAALRAVTLLASTIAAAPPAEATPFRQTA